MLSPATAFATVSTTINAIVLFIVFFLLMT